MPTGITGKSSATITAAAFVERAAAAYLGLETKVSSPGPACSMPFRPVISRSGEAFSRRNFRADAMAKSFIAKIDRTLRAEKWAKRARLLNGAKKAEGRWRTAGSLRLRSGQSLAGLSARCGTTRDGARSANLGCCDEPKA